MNRMRTILALAAAGALVACASQKEPAQAALGAAEQAVAGVKAEAERYVPDQFKALSGALAGAKDLFTKGEYEKALAAAGDVTSKVKDVIGAVNAKKAELTKAWEQVAGAVPKMMEVLKSRLDVLSQAKKLPAGLDAAKLGGAKGAYEAAAGVFAQAGEALKAGNLQEAVAKGTAAKAKAAEAMTALGMQMPQ